MKLLHTLGDFLATRIYVPARRLTEIQKGWLGGPVPEMLNMWEDDDPLRPIKFLGAYWYGEGYHILKFRNNTLGIGPNPSGNKEFSYYMMIDRSDFHTARGAFEAEKSLAAMEIALWDFCKEELGNAYREEHVACKADLDLKSPEWLDVSNGNDACACFLNERLHVTLYVDYPNPADREAHEKYDDSGLPAPRFSLVFPDLTTTLDDPDWADRIDWETERKFDTMAKVEAFIAKPIYKCVWDCWANTMKGSGLKVEYHTADTLFEKYEDLPTSGGWGCCLDREMDEKDGLLLPALLKRIAREELTGQFVKENMTVSLAARPVSSLGLILPTFRLRARGKDKIMHDTALKFSDACEAFDTYRRCERYVDSLDDLEALARAEGALPADYNGKPLRPEILALVQAFAASDATCYVGRG